MSAIRRSPLEPSTSVDPVKWDTSKVGLQREKDLCNARQSRKEQERAGEYNNTYDNLRIVSQEVQRQNSKGISISLYWWSRIRPAQIQAQVRGWMFKGYSVLSLYWWSLVSCGVLH